MDAQEHTTDRQKILNEIKRLKDWEPETIPQPQRRKEIQCARLGVLIGLEEFINSLPAEQPSRELESEIKLYLLRNPVVNHSETSLNEFIKRVAIYFSNWQEQQTINKALEWLADNVIHYLWKGSGGGIGIRDDFFIDFEKAMEDEQ